MKIFTILKQKPTEQNIINTYFIIILIVSFIRYLIWTFLLKSEYNYDILLSEIITVIMILLPYKTKINIISIFIFFLASLFFITKLFILNQYYFLGYELYYYPLIIRIFLLLDIKKHKTISFIILAIVFILLIFVSNFKFNLMSKPIYDINIKKYTYNSNIIIAYFQTFLGILFIYFKYTFKIDVSENKIIQKEIEIKSISNNKILEVIDLAKENHPAFVTKFEEIYPELNKKLIDNNIILSKSEIKLCAMMFIKLSNKEISEALNLEYRSIITKKYLIRKKLNINENTNLENWANNK